MNDHIAPPALRPVRGAAGCAVATLVLAGAAWAARAVWQIRLTVAGQPPSGPLDQGENHYHHLVINLGDAAIVLCAVAFLLWLWRVRDNAGTLSGQRPRYAGPWVHAGWIVPIASLWIPRGIIADIHRASAPDKRLPHAVNWWWGLWLVGFLGGAGLYAGTTNTVIARAYTDTPLLLVTDAAVIGAAVAAILVVRALTAVQQNHIHQHPRRGAEPAVHVEPGT
ncbi:DUF4328 domain-containing protein [Streptomyces sp. NBC_01456]|uniref:DUF4328 domain-containing protein n=1 Tax=unclassified Streptomyces TaxID=2593676 RepID=UPI002E356BDD|nr:MULTISPECIES: DUF4328 domain-containing protein [unclassified Streptomyces]